MQALKKLSRTILTQNGLRINHVPVAGLKAPIPFIPNKSIQLPEKPRLKVVSKTPVQNYPASMRPLKMQKRLRLMRGPETIHNTLLHEQFGIVALGGGRLKYEHFEMIRMTLIRMMNYKKAFAIWRVDPPWQPVTQKSQGLRMGGGKGNIAFYVTPVKKDRIIIEVAGPCSYEHVGKALENIAARLPFKARAVSQEMLEAEAAEKEWKEKNNLNPFSWQYIIQNNLLGYRNNASRYERQWFNKYV